MESGTKGARKVHRHTCRGATRHNACQETTQVRFGPIACNNKNRRKGKHSGPGQAAPQNKKRPDRSRDAKNRQGHFVAPASSRLPSRRAGALHHKKKRPRPCRGALFYRDKSTRHLTHLSRPNHKYFCFAVSPFPAVTYSRPGLPTRAPHPSISTCG